MTFDFVKLVSAVSAALKAAEAVSDIADAIADTMDGDDQRDLKAALAEIRAENDAARARRAEKLRAAS